VRWILPLDGILRQRRKGAAAEPCVNHLVEVANLVAQAAQASEPSLIIAALLHDTIEDQDVKAETIAKEFGNTSPKLWWKWQKSLPKVERKRLQVEHAAQKSRDAKLIKRADKISNLRAMQTVLPRTGPWNVGSNTRIGQTM